MKNKLINILGRKLYVWKWGFNFNEGGHFTVAVNLMGLPFYMAIAIKRRPTGVDNEKNQTKL